MIASKDSLFQFTEQLFLSCGMSEEHSRLASDILLSADLRGIDSHGVARLSGYVRLWENKRANFNPDWKIIHETPSTATIDADSGLGLVVAPAAMKLAIRKAEQVGTGWVALQHSNHFGIAAYHAMLALPHDMIGIAMTNASPLVAPTFSTERMLGTNPMCYAFPARSHQPVIVDMATSAAANGKLEIAQRTGKKIPNGWVQTKEGNESTNPFELKDGGSLLPLGGYKGYGLGAVVDILTAVLSGANYGPWVPPFVSFLDPVKDQPGKGIGHFIGAMRIDAFRPKDDYYHHMDQWINRFKLSKRAHEDQEVLIPGELEYRESEIRKVNGIPLTEAVVKDLQTLGERFGIPFKLS
jgi:LDH2 family malate/lactate/ureidoglycolate dehydrogenase